MVGILLDRETGDIITGSGGAVTGESEAQTAEAVIKTMRGEWKETPLLGGEAVRQLAGQPDVMWPGNVREMLRACGVSCEKVTVTCDGIIEIE